MNKYWGLVVVAAIFEVIWVTGLKYADDVFSWIMTVIGIVVSFGLLIYAGKKLPTSTVYAVFVGLGAAGTVVSESLWFDVPFSITKGALIALLLVGIIGLKAASESGNGEKDHSEQRKETESAQLRGEN